MEWNYIKIVDTDTGMVLGVLGIVKGCKAEVELVDQLLDQQLTLIAIDEKEYEAAQQEYVEV
jgi:hypothetical protein